MSTYCFVRARGNRAAGRRPAATARHTIPCLLLALMLTLAAVNTLGISVDLPTALLLSVVAALSAAGASGVAGGSLLLIPLSCGLFGIPDDVAMQVVAVGFVISVLQDSAETALNSSTDVVFTAAVSMASSKVAVD